MNTDNRQTYACSTTKLSLCDRDVLSSAPLFSPNMNDAVFTWTRLQTARLRHELLTTIHPLYLVLGLSPQYSLRSKMHVLCVCVCVHANRSSSLWMWPLDLWVRGWEQPVEWPTLENTLTRPGNIHKITLYIYIHTKWTRKPEHSLMQRPPNMQTSAGARQPRSHLHILM